MQGWGYLASCFAHAVVVAVSTSFDSNAAHSGCNLLMEDHLSANVQTVVLNSLSESFTKTEGTIDSPSKAV